MAPFDSVCSGGLVPVPSAAISGTVHPLRAVPSDRYNGTIGAIFSLIFSSTSVGTMSLYVEDPFITGGIFEMSIFVVIVFIFVSVIYGS